MKSVPVKQQVSAGGVIFRPAPEGYHIALIRRSSPKGDDVWCLPKGWVETGETNEAAAVREVEEETGLTGRIIRKLGVITYWFFDPAQGVRIHKTVHFFLMAFTGGDTSRHDDEVLEARWLGAGEAESRLAYAGEKDIFKKARRALAKGGLLESSPKILSLGLAVALLLSGCVTRATHEALLAQYHESDNRNAELQKEVASLKADADRARNSLAEAQSRLRSMKSSTENRESDLELLTERNVAMSKEIETLQRRNRDLTESIDSGKSRVENLKAQIEALEFLSKKLSGQVEDYRSRADAAEKARTEAARKIRDLESGLRDALKGGLSDGTILITPGDDRVQLRFSETALFDPGGLEISPEGRDKLKKISKILTGGSPLKVDVQGHTDNVPIGPRLAGKFPSNWELSTLRASRIARFLVDEGGVDPGLVSASGFADARPVADNDTPEGRALNRRIEISLIPADRPIETGSPSTQPESEESP